ncbi:MAG: hypothetical protein MZU97_24470 [Bacillus subtilis]|nr:hypothetical protein [Bacillus subtilis]
MFKFIGKKTLIIALSILVVGAMTAVGIILATGGKTTTASTAENGAVVPRSVRPGRGLFPQRRGSVLRSPTANSMRNSRVNDGINQLLFMVDSILLAEALGGGDRRGDDGKGQISHLRHSPTTRISRNSPTEDREQYEDTYAQNMILLGYAGQ